MANAEGTNHGRSRQYGMGKMRKGEGRCIVMRDKNRIIGVAGERR